MSIVLNGSTGVVFPAGGTGNTAGAAVGTTDTQTLTNKTLTSPTISGATINSSTINGGSITLATAQASTSGTAIDFTGIPSWVKRITVMLQGVSSNGTSGFLVQIGPSGGPETSGYAGSIAYVPNATSPTTFTVSSGFSVAASSTSAATVINGQVVLNLLNPATNTWAMSGIVGGSDNNYIHVSGGIKSLAGVLSQVRLSANGNTFDAGTINIMYEG